MSKKVKKQKKRNTKNFRKSLRKKSKSSKELLLKSKQNKISKVFEDVHLMMRVNNKIVHPTNIEDSSKVVYTPSYKTLNEPIRKQIENHLKEYPTKQNGCYVNGTLLSLKVPEIKTVHGYYGNTIESEFGVNGDNPNQHKYIYLLNKCLNSNEKYVKIGEYNILDTQKKKIWYKHCWNKVGNVHIDMTVEVQRLHNNSFNGFMEYLECDSFYSSSVSELNEIDKKGLTEFVYESQSGIKYNLN